MLFEKKLIQTSKLPAKYAKIVVELDVAKKDHDAGKLTKVELDKTIKQTGELIRVLVDYVQRKKIMELERSRLRVKHGERMAELTFLGNRVFLLKDVNDKDALEQAEINRDGKIDSLKPCKPEEYEQALTKLVPKKTALTQPLFESITDIFGKNAEILL